MTKGRDRAVVFALLGVGFACSGSPASDVGGDGAAAIALDAATLDATEERVGEASDDSGSGSGSDAVVDSPGGDSALLGDAEAGPDGLADSATADPCAGSYLLCDDFNASAIDLSKWTIGDVDIAQTYPVRPDNVALATMSDNGATISVVDATIFGDLHTAAPRQGGLLITNVQYGGGRYEARMKNLPGPNGCTCMWNYYDSLNEPTPPPTRAYTEIDIEMPVHLSSPPAWGTWERTLGFNTWSHSDADSDATYLAYDSPTVNPFDGEFHVFRWDWYDGTNGPLEIDWYVDGILQTSTDAHVSDHPAQLWVGNWPAPWPGMVYSFDTAQMYIDWVRISSL